MRIGNTIARDSGIGRVKLIIIAALALLLVVAIVAIVIIVVPNVTGSGSYGEEEAAAAELFFVQSAVDIMMAATDITEVTATSATNDMSAFPIGTPIYPNYLRSSTTKSTYSCAASGMVTQVSTGY